MVGATMGLLAFMLAFTFNGAAGRHSARKALVIQEANAIYATWLRAGFMPEPSRVDIRGLLRDYVDVRVKAAAGQVELAEAVRRSDRTLHAFAERRNRPAPSSSNHLGGALPASGRRHADDGHPGRAQRDAQPLH